MEECIFCQIVAGRLPAYKVYENEEFLAFLDIRPRSPGHTLVIPKKHYPWVYDVPDFGRYWETVLRITRAIQQSLKPDFVSYLTYGLEVEHAHIHIIPHQNKQTAQIWPLSKNISAAAMQEIAEKIRKKL